MSSLTVGLLFICVIAGCVAAPSDPCFNYDNASKGGKGDKEKNEAMESAPEHGFQSSSS